MENDKVKERLSQKGLAQEIKKKTDKIEDELYLKDLQYAAGILEIPIDGNGNTICTESEQTQFLVLMYGILQYQIVRLKNAQNSMLADIKKLDSKVAEKLTKLKLL